MCTFILLVGLPLVLCQSEGLIFSLLGIVGFFFFFCFDKAQKQGKRSYSSFSSFLSSSTRADLYYLTALLLSVDTSA